MHIVSVEGPTLSLSAPAQPAPAPRGGPRGLQKIDEVLGGPEASEFEPAGNAVEASRSAQSFDTLLEYRVPDNRVAQLVEVSFSIESNGEAIVSTNGVKYGPITGATDLTLPLDGAILTEGQRVRVLHQSTDGNSTTTRASLTAKEV